MPSWRPAAEDLAGNASAASTSTNNSLDYVKPSSQTITFGPIGDHHYGDTFTLSVTASSGLPVSLSLIAGPAVLTGNTLSVTGVGTVTVEAYQAGALDYLPATEDVSFAALPVPLTITADDQTKVYGAALPALSYLVAGLLESDTLSAQPALSTTVTAASPAAPTRSRPPARRPRGLRDFVPGRNAHRDPAGHGGPQRTLAAVERPLDGHGHQVGRQCRPAEPDFRLDGQRDSEADVHLGHGPDRHVRPGHAGRRRRGQHGRRLGDSQRRPLDRHNRFRHGHGGNTPRVANVVVGSDAWSDNFLGYLAAQNPNNAGGYSIPVGSGAQLLPLPWTNIDEIKVSFNENVTVDQTDLMLEGVNTPSTTSAVARSATTRPPSPPPGRCPRPSRTTSSCWSSTPRRRPIRDALGNRLDGEWSNPVTTSDTGTSQYPSGNGTPGSGNFVFRFNVLPGDVNQGGYVQAWTGCWSAGRWGDAGQGNYSIFRDVNGDGNVLAERRPVGARPVGNQLARGPAGGHAVPGRDGR